MRKNEWKDDKEIDIKKVLYISISLLVIAFVAFAITSYMYNNETDIGEKVGILNTNIVEEYNKQGDSNDVIRVNLDNKENNENVLNIDNIENNENEEEIEKVAVNTSEIEQRVQKERDEAKEITSEEANSENIEVVETNTKPAEETKDPSFVRPVQGNVIKKFAKENLIYSETLGEWIVHNGIDIKADKTTVVKAAEAGIIKYIKNDPRYGLTIVIEHNNGYKTIYSNLLSTEFVVEGEKVEKEQAIGTVGTTATFEILDDPHLHFEIIKDDQYLDPELYLNK